MSLEAVLLLSTNEPNSNEEQLRRKSPEKRTLAKSSDDNEEPQMKRTRSSTDDHNYLLLTPPSTPVASESAKNQVESQKDASSLSKANTTTTTTSEKNTENSPKSSSSERVDDKMNEAHEYNASPENMKSSSENRPSSPSKNVKHVVDRPKEPTEKPSVSTPECTCDQRLSGSMIDSYFTYFHRTILSFTNQKKTYIFSVSFYPLLTSDSSKAMKLRKGLAEKRHSQVESITRNVDIFEKDFIIFPIEKHGHWLVVIVCFPGLTGPVEYQQKEQIKMHSPKKNLLKDETATGSSIGGKARRTRLGCHSVNEKRNSKETADCDMGSNKKSVGCSKSPTKTSEYNQGQDDRTSNESQPIKQPCILVFDSSPKPRKTEVVQVIRDYIRVEYKVKHGKDKDFSTFMKDSKPKVPTRKNTECCGVYMLQYADSFFNNPIVDFRLPIKHIQNWFPADAISRKRDEIFRFVPRPTGGGGEAAAACASQMLHVKSCQKGKASETQGRRQSSDDSVTGGTKEAKRPITVLDGFRAVAVLEDCNTSDDITDDFRGFDLDQPLDGLLSPDRRTTSTLTADLLNDDDNAMMNVISEEEVVTMSDPSNPCTPELFVALSRSDYVPPQKKNRVRTRTATTTALMPKTLPPSKRRNVCSENALAAQQHKSSTTSTKSEPDDNSTSIPLRTHHFNELWKTIQKMDKKMGRRCRK